MSSTVEIYKLLLNRFGSQGWWPTTPQGKTLPVYHPLPKVENLSENEKFEICVGAILTQNTAWANVEKALIQLNKKKACSPQKIAKLPFGALAKLIRSSGYFRQKSKKLKLFSKYLIRSYKGRVGLLLGKPLHLAREELLNLYGLGPETVDSILLYAGAYPIFVVDAYTRRVGNRVGLFKTENYSEVQNYFHDELKNSSSPAVLFNEFHALLVALGKNICKTKPLCGECPLREVCRTGQNY